jgi:hypothetical protein
MNHLIKRSGSLAGTPQAFCSGTEQSLGQAGASVGDIRSARQQSDLKLASCAQPVDAISYLATVRMEEDLGGSSAVLVHRCRLENQRPGPDRRRGVYLWDWEQKVTLLPGHCGCGSARLRVADIAGRRDDFRYGELLVPASAFRYVLRHRSVSLARYGHSNPELSASASSKRSASRLDRQAQAVHRSEG